MKDMEDISLDLTQTFPQKPLSSLFEMLHEDTQEHSLRVEVLAEQLGGQLKLSKKEIEQLRVEARYHDIGKLLIPMELIKKTAVLSSSEYLHVKQHAICGAAIMSIYFEEDVVKTIMYHHENVDGSGYYGLREDQIPYHSRILHICDVYDALIHKRTYKEVWLQERAIQYIGEEKGKQFDEEVAEVFVKNVGKWV